LIKNIPLFLAQERKMFITQISEVFQFCAEQVKAGCKTSSELEQLLWKKYPLMSKIEAYRFVRQWVLDLQKIENKSPQEECTRAYSNEQNNQQNEQP
jgi:hypothetical protein